uniref:50S ribosomal protein 5, chloroplastic isoform X1 n=1 Tax=Ziziphus jujuba TaxID=326968 RepID=A0A6P4AIL3_ZIZJJ
MALLCSSTCLTKPLFSSSSSSSLPSTPYISSLQVKLIGLQPKSYGVQIQMPFIVKRSASVVVKASSDTDGSGPTDGSEAPSDGKDEVVPVNKLPLESKLKERQEQKLRMKLAKKIRLRRKRLVRKRRLRKKGNWPPSKMKKLKNV